MNTSIYSEYFSQLLIILLSWWKKKPYDFGRRCIKYFCNFLFIYTTLTDIFIIMRAVTAFIIIYTYI